MLPANDVRKLLGFKNATAISLASVVVNKHKPEECHFPISIAFATHLGPVATGANSLSVFTPVHLDPIIYKNHVYYDEFIEQLEKEKETNPEYRFYSSSPIYYNLRDVQEIFADILSDNLVGGHYYFKYVLPLLQKYGFLDLLDGEKRYFVENEAFDTIALYLLYLAGYNGLNNGTPIPKRNCREIFTYFANLPNKSNLFKGTGLFRLYTELSNSSLDEDDTATCLDRANIIIKLFFILIQKLFITVGSESSRF